MPTRPRRSRRGRSTPTSRTTRRSGTTSRARTGGSRPLRLVSGVYVLVCRGTPVIVQIFFVYFGANLLFGITLIPNTVHLGLVSLDGAAVAGIVALAINEGAFMREIIRAGIDSVDKGQ